jgi:hypothetical protein
LGSGRPPSAAATAEAAGGCGGPRSAIGHLGDRVGSWQAALSGSTTSSVEAGALVAGTPHSAAAPGHKLAVERRYPCIVPQESPGYDPGG